MTDTSSHGGRILTQQAEIVLVDRQHPECEVCGELVIRTRHDLGLVCIGCGRTWRDADETERHELAISIHDALRGKQ